MAGDFFVRVISRKAAQLMPTFYAYVSMLLVVFFVSSFQTLGVDDPIAQAPYMIWVASLAVAALCGALWGACFYVGYFGPPEAAVSPVPFIATFLVFSMLMGALFHPHFLDSGVYRRESFDQFMTKVPNWPIYLAYYMRVPAIIFLLVTAPLFVLGWYKWVTFREAKREVQREGKRMVKETDAFNAALIRDQLPNLPRDFIERTAHKILPSLIKYDHSVREWWINHIEDNPELVGLPPRF